MNNNLPKIRDLVKCNNFIFLIVSNLDKIGVKTISNNSCVYKTKIFTQNKIGTFIFNDRAGDYEILDENYGFVQIV